MRQIVMAAAVLVVGLAARPEHVLALGCDAKTQVPGHTTGNLGITDVPTTPCPVGHYANLQKKRNASALFAQPKDLTQPQTGTQQ